MRASESSTSRISPRVLSNSGDSMKARFVTAFCACTHCIARGLWLGSSQRYGSPDEDAAAGSVDFAGGVAKAKPETVIPSASTGQIAFIVAASQWGITAWWMHWPTGARDERHGVDRPCTGGHQPPPPPPPPPPPDPPPEPELEPGATAADAIAPPKPDDMLLAKLVKLAPVNAPLPVPEYHVGRACSICAGVSALENRSAQALPTPSAKAYGR